MSSPRPPQRRTPQRRAAHSAPCGAGGHSHTAQHLNHAQAKHLAAQIRATGGYLAWVHLLAPGTWGVQVSDRAHGGVMEFACWAEWESFQREEVA